MTSTEQSQVDKTILLIVGAMTPAERERMTRRLWKARRREDGYQPFGYDAVTLKMCYPEFVSAIRVLNAGQLVQV